MLNVHDFRTYVIRPTLKRLDLYTPAAERLVLGTALVESNLAALDQGSDDKPGPAYGLYQMEPATLHDIWNNFLDGRSRLKATVFSLLAPAPAIEDQLATNLAFATAMCRVYYVRRPEPLPEKTSEQGEYWKRFYNTPLGKGSPADFLRAWRLAGLAVV